MRSIHLKIIGYMQHLFDSRWVHTSIGPTYHERDAVYIHWCILSLIHHSSTRVQEPKIVDKTKSYTIEILSCLKRRKERNLLVC